MIGDLHVGHHFDAGEVSVGLERFDVAPDDLVDAVEENLADGASASSWIGWAAVPFPVGLDGG